MSTKSFLFIASWMKPLKNLPLQERWNVLEAIVEYSTFGTLSISLNAMENIAFSFIRNEIDRMKQHRSEVCERRRAAANTRWGKERQPSKQTDATVFNELPDANACKEMHSDETVSNNELPDANACKDMHHDAPYHISVSESKSESDKKSSTTSSCARERGNAEKETPNDDYQPLQQLSNGSHQAKIGAISDMAELERKSCLQAIVYVGGVSSLSGVPKWSRMLMENTG